MNNATIAAIEDAQLRKDIPEFRVGDTVRVHYKIVEGDKERVQVFQGVVIKRHRAGARSSFTVRKVSSGVGVERVFPQHSPRVEKIEQLARGVVRRARLFYLRELSGKAARLKDERDKLSALFHPAAKPAYAARIPRRKDAPRSSEVRWMIQCARCGAQNNPADKFCMTCGARLAPAGPSPGGPAPGP